MVSHDSEAKIDVGNYELGSAATPTIINAPVSNAIVTPWHSSKSMTTVSKFFFFIFVVI